MKFRIYRFNPEQDRKPYLQDFELEEEQITPGMMLLDALLLLKAQDESLGFRRSCGEGVCGSDGMNINGVNGLACITPLASLKRPVQIRPLPGLPVVRDLVVNLETAYERVKKAMPYLLDPAPDTASATELPVLPAGSSNRPIGLIDHRDLVKAYGKEILKDGQLLV